MLAQAAPVRHVGGALARALSHHGFQVAVLVARAGLARPALATLGCHCPPSWLRFD